MLTDKASSHHQNQLIIFVENSLYVSGISRILSDLVTNIREVTYEEVLKFEQRHTTCICHVLPQEMERRAKVILSQNPSVELILIKSKITFEEVYRLIGLGVKGLCLTDVDETYLINLVKQVKNGYLFIDHRLTQIILNEYIYLRDNQYNITINDAEMKELLTKREIDILTYLVKGFTNNQIGKELYISEKTVKNHVCNIFDKLNVNDRLNAALKAIKNGWIPLM